MNSHDLILTRLRENPGPNLRAIEELTKFAGLARIFTAQAEDPEKFAYLLISGHPSTMGRAPSVIMGGNAGSASALTQHLPQGPYTILETPKEFLKALEGKLPESSEIFLERRMELRKAAFRAAPASPRARRLVETDAEALADFSGAPPQAAPGMRNWIKGAAFLLGIFEGPKLIAMGSTFCSVPEGWSLVSIKTREGYLRKGLASEVTSALCAKAFETVGTVGLTVLSDNAPAIALYQKLGFTLCEERVWIDCGSGSKPYF